MPTLLKTKIDNQGKSLDIIHFEDIFIELIGQTPTYLSEVDVNQLPREQITTILFGNDRYERKKGDCIFILSMVVFKTVLLLQS